jgi:hypothetical protein
VKAARTVRPGGRWKRTRLGGHLASGLPELEHTSTGDGGQFRVTICRNGTSLLIGVSDSGSDKTPAPGPLNPESETGRGLGLVELIAERWGYCGDQHGLTVWFELQAVSP